MPSTKVSKVSTTPFPVSRFPVVLMDLRAEKEWTQRQLADWLGVSQSCIHRWEVGQRQPSLAELTRIGYLLRITWTLP